MCGFVCVDTEEKARYAFRLPPRKCTQCRCSETTSSDRTAFLPRFHRTQSLHNSSPPATSEISSPLALLAHDLHHIPSSCRLENDPHLHRGHVVLKAVRCEDRNVFVGIRTLREVHSKRTVQLRAPIHLNLSAPSFSNLPVSLLPTRLEQRH